MSTPPATPYFSVIMPVFNERDNVAGAIPALIRAFESAACTYEIVVVDDGSVDGTGERVRELQQTHSHIRLFRHRANLGPGSGIYTGIAVARGVFVIFIPADLAMNPSELRKFIDASRDCDIVNGLRSDRRDYSVGRKVMSLVNIGLISLLFGMRLRQYNYIQAYRRAIFDCFYPQSMGVFITAEILIAAHDLGFRIVEVEIEYRPRMSGKTGVANWRSIRKTLVELFTFWARRATSRTQGGTAFDSARHLQQVVLPLIIQD